MPEKSVIVAGLVLVALVLYTLFQHRKLADDVNGIERYVVQHNEMETARYQQEIDARSQQQQQPAQNEDTDGLYDENGTFAPDPHAGQFMQGNPEQAPKRSYIAKTRDDGDDSKTQESESVGGGPRREARRQRRRGRERAHVKPEAAKESFTDAFDDDADDDAAFAGHGQ